MKRRKKKIVQAFEEKFCLTKKKAILNNIYEIHSELDDRFEAILENKELAFELLSEANCPNCGTKGEFTEPRNFNLMFKTFVGSLESAENTVFLRPETAQGIFVNFQNVQNSSRQKLPFGIAQIGKAFRNEINTKNFLFRTREFEQMEMQ